MPKSFAITAAKQAVKLDVKRTAEASFTIANTTERPFRCQLHVRPMDSTQTAWLTLVGDVERDFAAQSTMQVTVRIALPAGVPPESYGFRLDAVSLTHPADDFSEGPIVLVDVTSAEAPQGRPSRKWIAIVAAVAVLAIGCAVWWLVVSRGQIPVPDLNNKPVDEARRIIADAQLKLREEQQEENATREGFVIAQDPAPSSKVRPGSSVKIVVAVAPKPKMLVDVSGRWDSSTNSRYDVMSLGSDLFFRSVVQGPSPEPLDERGSGSVSESAVTAQWTGENGKHPTSGRVVHKDDKGIAQAIRWNNGVIWFRPKEEGTELVRHYKLDQYNRATILEAIQKEAENDDN